MFYILDENLDHKKVDDVLEWARFFEDICNRRVIKTTLQLHPFEISVSTIFTGLDVMAEMYGIAPLLYESMVFRDGHGDSESEKRYATRKEALNGHIEICERVKKSLYGDKLDSKI